ncbi:DUF2207 domain-containing protein [Lipingzhangella sp. LS1_29]|uniref:DUF2207 domain-containing protein n=1 Tax=Lipingzhangella rawalii TaxID=2055835 RepID=A0ABU2H249_9ACTN|nr:DUF2207 domain-containing protein [Lipingzhangella rawalii]MDS1269380.1 DUF2207 domain-containing protein [Lipingzhangella rawalii]
MSAAASPTGAHFRRVLTVSVGLVLGVAALAPSGAADDTEMPPDEITAYHTAMDIQADGRLDITETITYDFGDIPSPGISREIPLHLERSLFTEERMDIAEVAVSSPSGADDTIDELREERGELRLLVGDASDETTDVVGEQTYEISYQVQGALRERTDGIELRWDFVGTEWDVPIRDVEVEISAPAVRDLDCFRGPPGSYTPCDVAELVASDTQEGAGDVESVYVADPSLESGSGLTGEVSLPPGAVEVVEPSRTLRPAFVLTPWAAAAIALALLVSLPLGFLLYSRLTARSRFGTARPDGLSAELAGYMVAGCRMRTHVLLAMVVELEQRGIIEAHRSGRGVWVFRQRVPSSDWQVTSAEERLLEVMFAERAVTSLVRIARQLDHKRVRGVTQAIINAGTQAGMLRTELGCLVFFVGALALAGAGVLFFAGLVVQITGVALIIMALVAAGVLALAQWRPLLLTSWGRHVRRMLVATRREATAGRSTWLTEYPAWAVAVDVPNKLVAHAPRIAAEARERYAEARPYYCDDGFRRSWHRRVDRRINPERYRHRGSSSSGSRSGGTGSGGGGGGGGRR